MPALRSFLKDKDGLGADAYENLDVVFISGRRAVLTIYDVPDAVESSKADNREGWVEKEKIILSDYKTKNEMHTLMAKKGFRLKPVFEIETELDHVSNDSEELEKRQKIEEQLRNEESSSKDEL